MGGAIVTASFEADEFQEAATAQDKVQRCGYTLAEQTSDATPETAHQGAARQFNASPKAVVGASQFVIYGCAMQRPAQQRIFSDV